MEEDKSSKSRNHETRKSACIVCEESNAVRVATSENYMHNKNDKSIKEAEKSSSSGSGSKKNKQNEFCPEKPGENKSCITNSCIAGCKRLEINLPDQNQSKGERSSNLPSTVENPKESTVLHMDENPPSSQGSSNGDSTETSPTAQNGNSELENPLGDDRSKMNMNWPKVSGKSGLDQSSIELKKPEDSCEYHIPFLINKKG